MASSSSAFKGMILAPVLICFIFLMKALCQSGGENICYVDQFAYSIFLPVVTIYKILGVSKMSLVQEFFLLLFCWALAGLIFGLAVDMFMQKTRRLNSGLGREAVASVNTVELAQVHRSPPASLVKPEPTPASSKSSPKPPINLLDREEYKSL